MILTRLERSILRELSASPLPATALGTRILGSGQTPERRRYRMLMKLGRMRVRGLVRSVGTVNGDSVWSLTEVGRRQAALSCRHGKGVAT